MNANNKNISNDALFKQSFLFNVFVCFFSCFRIRFAAWLAEGEGGGGGGMPAATLLSLRRQVRASSTEYGVSMFVIFFVCEFQGRRIWQSYFSSRALAVDAALSAVRSETHTQKNALKDPRTINRNLNLIFCAPTLMQAPSRVRAPLPPGRPDETVSGS